jgi:hypothetical protein
MHESQEAVVDEPHMSVNAGYGHISVREELVEELVVGELFAWP